MSETITRPTRLEDMVAERENVDPAVPVLIERLRQQSRRYATACADGRRGYSQFLLSRMEATNKRILELLDGAPACCHPYRTARHTGDCLTMTHTLMAFASADSGLTVCGLVGPIVEEEPTCDTCAGRQVKPGATTYPALLDPLTARQYDIALEEARGWLADCGMEPSEEPWNVWRRVNAQYEGGVESFLAAIDCLLDVS